MSIIDELIKKKGKGFIDAVIALHGSLDAYLATLSEADKQALLSDAQPQLQPQPQTQTLGQTETNKDRMLRRMQVKDSLQFYNYLSAIEYFLATLKKPYSTLMLNYLLTPYRIKTFYTDAYQLMPVQVKDVTVKMYATHLKKSTFMFYSYIDIAEYKHTTLKYMHKLSHMFGKDYCHNLNLIHSINRHAIATYALNNKMTLEEISYALGHAVKVTSVHYVNDDFRKNAIIKLLDILLSNDRYKALVERLI